VLVALAAIAAFAIVAVPGAQARSAGEPAVDAEIEREVFAAINQTRRTQGVSPLRRSGDLTTAARTHATAMGREGFFSHSSADGTSANRRISAFYEDGGSGDWAVSEVIQWAAGTATAEEALEAWLASDPHRRELLRPSWREVGAGVVRVDGAPGVFGGRSVTILVVDFGRR
jgi:uncharacterized protein YkwD